MDVTALNCSSWLVKFHEEACNEYFVQNGVLLRNQKEKKKRNTLGKGLGFLKNSITK